MLRFATAADGLERTIEGVVRIATFAGMADDFLPPVCARLFERYPGLRLELDVSPGLADLTRREADLAIRSVRPQSGDLVMTKLLTSRWVLMAEHFAAVRRIVPVALGPGLRAAAEQWPVDDLWLVGHRALRDVPRVPRCGTRSSRSCRTRR